MEVIDLKLGELGKRLKLQTELIILRTVKDEKKLILLLGELLSIKNKWELGYKECYPKANEIEDFEICGFSIWIKLFKIS